MAKQMNVVNWFEILVNDLERAKKFYGTVFGAAFNMEEMGQMQMQMAMFPGIQKAPGTPGSLVKAEGYVPSHEGTVIYFSVNGIDDSLTKINAAGGKTLMPKTAIGKYGFIAQFEDSEGNRVALHSMK